MDITPLLAFRWVHPTPGLQLVYDTENSMAFRWLSLERYSCRSASFRGLVQAVSPLPSALISLRRTISPPDLSRICGGRVRRHVRVFLGLVYLFLRTESLRLLLR